MPPLVQCLVIVSRDYTTSGAIITEHGRALRARREVGSGQHSKRGRMKSCREGVRKSPGRLSASSPNSCLEALRTDARELSGKRHRSAPDSFL